MLIKFWISMMMFAHYILKFRATTNNREKLCQNILVCIYVCMCAGLQLEQNNIMFKIDLYVWQYLRRQVI